MDRRRFLVVIAALLVTPTVACSRPPTGSLQHLARQELEVVVADVEAAARLGRKYLAGLAVVPTAEQLAAEIAQTLGGVADDPAPANDSAIIDRARRAVADDYVHARVVDVDGWVFSITEARLFALAALGFPPAD